MMHAASWGEALFIAIVVGWFLVGWFRGLPSDRQGAISALVGAGMALLVNQVIGLFWARPRPFAAHPADVHVLLSHGADASFPSDHASAAFAIGVVLFTIHRKLGSLGLLLAVLMSYARVYVGDHYPGDVFAGALVGTLVAVTLVTWLEPAMRLLRRLADNIIRLARLPLPVDRPRVSPSSRG